MFLFDKLISFFPFKKNHQKPDFDEGENKLNDVLSNPALIQGVLDNGLKYYILDNNLPKNKLSVWLVLNKGSIVEDEHEQGVAHFLEHLLFAGTKHFSTRKDVMDLAAEMGAQFGPDLNAFTNCSNVTYLMNIPANQAALDRLLRLFSDFIDGALLTDEAIELERNVVINELDLRTNPSFSFMEFCLKKLYKGMIHAERFPAGKKEVIASVSPDVVRAFYKKYYQPAHAALIIVGACKGLDTQTSIKTYFGGIKNTPIPEQKLAISPEKRGLEVASYHDSKLDQSGIAFYLIWADQHPTTSHAYTYDLVCRALVWRVFSLRILSLALDADSPLRASSDSFYKYNKALNTYFLSVGLKIGRHQEGVNLFVEALARFGLYGITADEYCQARLFLKNRYHQYMLDNRHSTDNNAFAQALSSVALGEDSFADIEYITHYRQHVLESVTLDQLNSYASQYALDRCEALLVCFENTEQASLSQELVRSIIDTHKNQAPQQLVLQQESKKPSQQAITSGKITQRSTISSLDLTLLTLSNGMRVVIKKTDFKKNEVLFNLSARGGYSCLGAENYPSFVVANGSLLYSGFGGMSFEQRALEFSSQEMLLMTGIDLYERRIFGSCKGNSLGDMLCSINQFFTDRNDLSVGWKRSQEEQKQSLQRSNIPDIRYRLEIGFINAGRSPYKPILTPEDIESASFGDVVQPVRQFFENPADFTCFLVGDIEVNQALYDSLEASLASIQPTGQGLNTVVEVDLALPTTNKEVTLVDASVKAAKATFLYSCSMSKSPYDEVKYLIVSKILQKVLLDKLRFELGKTYATSVVIGPLSPLSSTENRCMISLPADNDDIDQLVSVAKDCIAKLVVRGITESELAEQQKITASQLTDFMQNNYYVSASLSKWIVNGYDFDDFEKLASLAYQVTLEDVNAALQSAFNHESLCMVFLRPEESKKDSESVVEEVAASE